MAFDLDDEELEATRELNGVGSTSEKDILNEIDFCLAGEYITMEHRQAIEGLLDLYNKEKEKVAEYEKQLDLDYVDKNYVSKEYHEMVVKEQNDIIEDLKWRSDS